MGALPDIQARMLSLLGRRPKRISKQDRAALEKKLGRATETLVTQFGRLQQIDPQAEPGMIAEVIEELFVSLMKIGGMRRKRGEDVLNFLARFAFNQTKPSGHPWLKKAEYEETRKALWDFVVHLHERLGAPAVRSAIDHWAEREGEGHISFVRQLDTAARRFRTRPPVRLTDRLAVDLRTEYQLASGFFEQRLRLLLYLAAEGTSKSKPWSEWRKVLLFKLLESAKIDNDLTKLIGGIDREVRNALAHGAPTIDMVTGTFQFDSGHPIRWTPQKFHERTRALTVTAVALNSLEALIEYAQVHWIIYVIRSLLQHATITGPPTT
jgi:hypothetical protein